MVFLLIGLRLCRFKRPERDGCVFKSGIELWRRGEM